MGCPPGKGLVFGFQVTFKTLPPLHQIRVPAVDASVVAISRGLTGAGSRQNDSGNGFFTLAKRAFLGILRYQVAATPPETMQATVPDGAEHGVSVVHCVIIVVMSRNLVDPRSRGNTTRPSGWRLPNWTGSSRELSTRGPPAVVGCTDSSNASAEERRFSGGLHRWARSGVARPWRQPPQATLRARLVVCRASLARGTWILDHNPQACLGAPGGSILSAFFKRLMHGFAGESAVSG